jgi:hypothetical protein
VEHRESGGSGTTMLYDPVIANTWHHIFLKI